MIALMGRVVSGSLPEFIVVSQNSAKANDSWLTAGAVIAFLLLGYLFYVLMKPEKF
jgi:K+-transporting ATPase KdpF subunit